MESVERRLPIYLLLDCSGDTAGEGAGIDSLAQGGYDAVLSIRISSLEAPLPGSAKGRTVSEPRLRG